MRLDDKEIMLLWEQGVAGSNPATPTTKNKCHCKRHPVA